MASNSLPVIWIPNCKYALNVLELPRAADCTDGDDVVTQFAALKRGKEGGPLPLMKEGGDPTVVGLAWVRARDILNPSDQNFHPFALQIIDNLFQYDSAEWEPAFLRQAREFLFFPLLPREASKSVPISEASKRVPIFSFATQGGKQVSSHFRQRNWIQAREAQIRFPAG